MSEPHGYKFVHFGFTSAMFDSSFTHHMQQGIKKEPSLVIKLRATFLKVIQTLLVVVVVEWFRSSVVLIENS